MTSRCGSLFTVRWGIIININLLRFITTHRLPITGEHLTPPTIKRQDSWYLGLGTSQMNKKLLNFFKAFMSEKRGQQAGAVVALIAALYFLFWITCYTKECELDLLKNQRVRMCNSYVFKLVTMLAVHIDWLLDKILHLTIWPSKKNVCLRKSRWLKKSTRQARNSFWTPGLPEGVLSNRPCPWSLRGPFVVRL